MCGICGKLSLNGKPVPEGLGIVRQGIFNYPVIKGLVDNLMAGRSDTSWQLWNLIAFQVWHSRYGKI